MKINGVVLENPTEHIVGPFPIERTNKAGMTVVYGIYAQPIWSYDEFHRLCPKPKPTDTVTAFSKSGKTTADPESPEHKANLQQYEEKREGYTILKALEPSQIELPTARLDDPNTWHLVRAEMTGMFSHFEFNAIIALIDRACGIDPLKVEANRKTFLSQQRPENPAPTGATNS